MTKQISIHTSAREVTRKLHFPYLPICDFNPHFREGSDGIMLDMLLKSMEISIHTSAREVTIRESTELKVNIISIHTSAREVT